MGYMYISQLLTIGRIYHNYKDFVERNRNLTERLIKQGYYYSKLCRYFKKFSKRHFYVFNKYDMCLKDHSYDGICNNPLCGFLSLNKNITIRTLHKHNVGSV